MHSDSRRPISSQCEKVRSFVEIRQLLLTVAILSLCILAAVAYPVPSNKPPSFPSWWFSRGVIVQTNPTNISPNWPTNYPISDDYAAVNEGQLKNFAIQAYAQLQATAPPSAWNTPAGTNLVMAIGPLGTVTTNTDDYSVINAGQLKAVAAPFYDFLKQLGVVTGYPWNGSGVDDYAVVNIGQLKNTFDFIIPPSAPVLTVTSQAYYDAQTVTLSPSNGQTYYYTIDGSDPSLSTNNNRIGVSGAITLSFTSSETIKVVALDNGTYSSISSASVSVDPNETSFDAYNRRPKYLLRPTP